MTNILWIHFLLMCFHGKLAELTLFLWNSSYFERNIGFWCLLTQLEFNDFRIQSHQIWHDICTFMHDQKNPSIGLWEKNSQWSKQRFRCWKNSQFMIFLSLRFYVKSNLEYLEVVKTAIYAILVALHFVDLANFSL